MALLTSLGVAAGGVAGVMLINKIVDYFGYKHSSQYKAQKERDERLAELQERHKKEAQEFQTKRDQENRIFQAKRDKENQEFQAERDKENRAFQAAMAQQQRAFQMEMEANRLAAQERMEMRRLQCQEQLEKKRIDMQKVLAEMNIKNSRDIAKFNAIAMRETQILVARENAQNLLQDKMVQDALKNFPLNISPLVLLKNRPHALSSLLRFTIGEKCNLNDVAKDVKNYEENPEALNIFVAPIYVDSKIRNRELLSRQIWDTTYQRLESFFIENYNRRGKRPVIFYPTAWNDRYSTGMHASETLHFFLRDMPCVVLEPRFDGNTFSIMVSSWGIGYASTEHIRTELKFGINIDAMLATAVVQRSKLALNALNDLNNADIDNNEKTPFIMQKRILERNIKLYESLRIEERLQSNQMNEIDALGIYNIFKIEPIQDLDLLAKYLSVEIGFTLAALADIHHLCSTDTTPAFPKLLKDHFPELANNKDVQKNLFKCYEKVFIELRKEDQYNFALEESKRNILINQRELQIDNTKYWLDLLKGEELDAAIKSHVCDYCKDVWDFEAKQFDTTWEYCLEHLTTDDEPFFGMLLEQLEDRTMYRDLKRALSRA